MSRWTRITFNAPTTTEPIVEDGTDGTVIDDDIVAGVISASRDARISFHLSVVEVQYPYGVTVWFVPQGFDPLIRPLLANSFRRTGHTFIADIVAKGA